MSAVLGKVRVARDRKMREIVLPSGTSGIAGRTGRSSTSRGSSTLRSDDAGFFNPGPSRIRRCRSTSPASISTCAARRRSVRTACTCTRSTARSTCASTSTPRGRRAQASGRKRADFTYTTASFAVIGDTDEELAKNRRSVKSSRSPSTPRRGTYEPCSPAPAGRTSTPALTEKIRRG